MKPIHELLFAMRMARAEYEMNPNRRTAEAYETLLDWWRIASRIALRKYLKERK